MATSSETLADVARRPRKSRPRGEGSEISFPALLSVKEVAATLRVTCGAVYRRVRRGTLLAVRDGRRILIPAEGIGALVEAGRLVAEGERSSEGGPRGQEPRVQAKEQWKIVDYERSWVSLRECKNGKADWEACCYIYFVGVRKPKEVRRRSPHKAKGRSEAWASRLLRRLQEEHAAPRDDDITVAQACDRWLDTQSQDVANKTRHVNWLLRVLGAEKPMRAISALDVEGVPTALSRPLGPKARARSRQRRSDPNGRRKRKGEGLGSSTIKAICQTGNAVFALGLKMGWCGEHRIKLPKLPITDAEWFTFAELEEFLRVADPQWRLAYLLAARAGLRRGEVVELRWSDVDLERGRIRVSRAYARQDDGTWGPVPTKGKIGRPVPLAPDLAAELAKHEGRAGELVVRTADGERVHPPKFTEQVKKDARRAGVDRPGVGPHTLRHTFCSHLALGNAHVTKIQALAGHASLRTTQRYMHLSPSDLDDAIASLPVLKL